jgi:hypothetical protein
MTYAASGYLVGGGRSALGGIPYNQGLGGWFWNDGNSAPAQLWAWITGTVAEASDDPPAVKTWLASVKQDQGTYQDGSVAVRWPFNDPFRGELAVRWENRDDAGQLLGYSYGLAPLGVINADRARRGVAAFAGDVILPLADGSLSVANVISQTAMRGALVVGGALLAYNVILTAIRNRG